MEYESIGKLIQSKRKEKGLTQKQLADMLNITDKAVSKWERDAACPDTTTIPKLSEILGISVEELLNAKSNSISSESQPLSSDSELVPPSYDEEYYECEEWRQEFVRIRNKGIIGFVIGFILGCLMAYQFSHSTGVEPSTQSIFLSWLLIPTLFGLTISGVPYGWELLTKATGGWSIYGNILIVIFAYLFKFLFSFFIGSLVYPFVLLYCFMKSKRRNSKARKITKTILITIVAMYIISNIIGIIVALVT